MGFFDWLTGKKVRQFKYRGIFNGRTEWGEVEAESEEAALRQLKTNGVEVEELNGRRIAFVAPKATKADEPMSRVHYQTFFPVLA